MCSHYLPWRSTCKILHQIKVQHLSYLISNKVRRIILHNLPFTSTMSFMSWNVEKKPDICRKCGRKAVCHVIKIIYVLKFLQVQHENNISTIPALSSDNSSVTWYDILRKRNHLKLTLMVPWADKYKLLKLTVCLIFCTFETGKGGQIWE